MNQNIVQYLRENKEKSPQDDLVKSLRQAGYPEDEIREAIALIYASECPTKDVAGESVTQKGSLGEDQSKKISQAKTAVAFTTFFSFFLFPPIAIPANIIGVLVYAQSLKEIPRASAEIIRVMVKIYLITLLVIAALFGACLLIFSEWW